MHRKPLLLLTLFILGLPLCAGAEPVDFQKQIQPLLARHCFACHGPDEEHREGELRLDLRAAAVEAGAIVPDKPDDSELVRRIFSEDADERMPPDDTKKPLDDEQKQLLKRWVAEGAKYQRHWSFVPPRRPPHPKVSDTSWPRTAIDFFVLARLEAAGRKPSPEADRYSLVRRVYLDLIGLPPTPAQADAFVNDPHPRAYERMVDRLLASPKYGERWARPWLDLARYADTNGYEKDRNRSIWPYRDWVIQALGDDMPYDQFTVEQLAGDMLPGAALSQRTATGFHRNTMLNEEGGIDPLEYRFYAMVDRVATTGAVWLGLTTGCAQCHSHKYDPITHVDYYRLMALMNNADEPDLLVEDEATVRRRDELQAIIRQREDELAGKFPDGQLETKFAEWTAAQRSATANWQIAAPAEMTTNLPRLELLKDGSIFSTGDITKRDVFRLVLPLDKQSAPVTAIRLEAMADPRLPAGGPGRAFYEGRKGDFFLSEVTARAEGKPVKFKQPSHSFGKISIGSGSADAANVIDGEGSTGWSTATREGQTHELVLPLAEPLAPAGTLELTLLFERHFAASLGRFRLSLTSDQPRGKPPAASQLPAEIQSLVVRDSDRWNDQQRRLVRRQFLLTAAELAEARKQVDQLRKQLPAPASTMVLQERPADNPRSTHRHHRGEYLSTREQVEPGLPAFLASEGSPQPTNRLELARWLVGPNNPLAARAAVNRTWRAIWGAGLVRTSADFGTQSEPPTHPQLLDYLAVEFREQGWSQKKLHRSIVTSAAYRQRSEAPAELHAADPTNRWLARGPRFRVEGEIVRDMTLHAAGLLTSKRGGPSVYPPQPPSVTQLAYGNTKWPASKGVDRYRRSLYTFSKRTAPFAAYLVFDGPTGENCLPRRDRSNTPLQALTMLNDQMFLEASQSLGRQAAVLDSEEPQRLAMIFRRLLTRPPGEDESAVLLEYRRRQLKRLEDKQLDPAKIGGPGATPEAASWAMTARVLMNLDEAITKP